MNQKDLDKIKMGYILAYKNDGSKYGNLIAKRQRLAGFSEAASQITHIEISGGEYDSIYITPPISKRIKINKVHKGRYVYVLKYDNKEFDKKRYKIAYFSASLNNSPYDIRGIISFVIKWIKQNKKLWFCSEGACWAFQRVFPDFLEGMNPSKCMPAHFWTSPELEVVWEGVL